MISKTHIVAQKPRRRQLNVKKVCGSKVPLFLFLFLRYVKTAITQKRFTRRNFSTKLMRITVDSSITTQRLHSFKFTLVNKSHLQHCGCCSLRRTPFSKLCTHAHVKSRSQAKQLGLGTELVHKRNRELTANGWHGSSGRGL